ncbi:MAG: hypothetical protein WA783_22675 [Phormidesmis sp.]
MNPTADGNSKQSQAAPIQPAPLPIDPLTEQIESQIETLEETIETESVADEDGEVQQRVQHLIGLIKASLQSRTLDPKTQRELARLLSLAPRLKGRHVQQLNLLDLAVSILLEPGSLNPNAAERATGAIANNQIANNQIANNQIALNKTAAKNLVFVQETRRQIAQQSRTYPDLLRAIFVTGEGTPYIRLISGLSWFFLVFVVAPLTVAGLTFAVRDIAGISTTRADLTKARTELTKQKNRNNELNLRQNALEAQLGRTRRWLANLEETADTAAADEASSDVTVTVDQQDLLNIRAGIDNAISNLDEADESEDESEVSNQENEDNTGQPENESTSSSPENNSFSLILLAVAMGALGSTISVIVRANTFIRQTEENNNDLFLTGFFRPFVGMSFAIFCVALIEAGIFSGIFDLNKREDAEEKIYLYVAIAFVSGFSERLVRDVVIKTEDTLAGPASGRDRWQ